MQKRFFGNFANIAHNSRVRVTRCSFMPFISVVIPTFRRLKLLRRAVASVQAQTYPDWNCLISDDEDPPGETWSFLQSLAMTDSRFRVLRNPPPRGQSNNMNTLMVAADGEWIKILHDDDVLRPNCLAALAAAVDGQTSVAAVSCGVAEYLGGRHLRDRVFPGRSLVERIPQAHAILGMYLQDDVGGGVPTQMMIRKSVIDKGVSWDRPEGIVSCVDSVFSMNVLRHGDSLIVRAPLVEWHQGDHESVTSSTSEAELDREYALLRALQLKAIDPALHPPSLRVSLQFLKLIRATNRASRRKFGQALSLAAQAWHPQAWALAAYWLMRRSGRYRWSRIPRIPVADDLVRAAMSPLPKTTAPASKQARPDRPTAA